jgi:hypothetical protein
MEGSFGLNTDALFDPARHSIVGTSTAFNLGGLAGLPGKWQMVPLMLWWGLIGAWILRALSRTKHGTTAA